MMKKLLTLLLLLTAFLSNAQNTLNNVGLTSVAPASVAFSLRQLSTSYTGPLVRIKIATNVFYDVYPDASTKKFSLSSKISASVSTYNAAVSAESLNALSTVITTGSTDATVAIWYDQSGNGVNVLASSPNAKIIASGSINTINGQPTINFTGTNSYLTSSTTVNYSSQSNATVNAVAQNVASTNYISGILSTGDNGGWGLIYNPTNNDHKGYWVDASGGNGAFSNEYTSEAKIVTGTIGTIASGTSSFIYINGTQKGTRGAQSIANGTTDRIYVGSRGNFAGRQFIGNISETIMFPKTLSADERAALESSQSTFFLAPSVTIASSASGAVSAGTSVTFTATTYNFSGTPTYQWYKNSVAINGETNASYTTSTLAHGDQIYVIASAVTSNSLNANITASAIVSVLGDGCINKTTLSTPIGQSSYAWYKDNVVIPSATTNTYTPTASGVYKVTVTNGSSTSTSSNTTLYECGRTADGSMVVVEGSSTLISRDGSKNTGNGVDDRGKILTKPWTYGTVSTATGRVWLDRNLGATRVATSSTDAAAYGDYFQWGRPADGHQTKYLTNNNSTGFTNTRSATAVPSTDLWIQPIDASNDWLSTPDNTLWTGANPATNPCPAGFRIPTEAEWSAENIANVGATFQTNGLKLTLPGMLTNFSSGGASYTAKGSYGQYLTQTAYTTSPNGGARYFGVNGSNQAWFDQNYTKSNGMSVRCIQN
jgi:uncharacterized protein (TIGR02145 family)